MTFHALRPALLVLFAVVSACSPEHQDEAKPAAAGKDAGALFTVGSITVNQTDLDYQLKESHGGRSNEEAKREALGELVSRAQLTQAALDADLQHDPMVRAEFARVLANRIKEKSLTPELQAAEASPPESRLRELYAAEESRFRSNEKRQVAVLWLNPNGNPEREKQYVEKLTTARDWFFQNGDLKDHPDQGFSTLGVDYSEHQASRYNSGIVGWMESGGGMDAWTKAVAGIAFSLKEPGEVSAVISKPEGVFLVRYMALKPAILRPFEAVAAELDQAERQRVRKTAESEFNGAIAAKYPVRWLNP
ncbi:MAG: peptidyl-prolyl cis-trans isomerase [Verrucomicrobiota bacterium]